MSQVIYVDILLLINLLVNYFLLLASNAILHTHPKRLRILISAAVGALYSLIIFLPDLNIVLSVSLRVVCSTVMVLIAFKINNIKTFLRSFGCFFMSNFAFAGIMLGVWLVLKPNGMVYKNGAVYFDIDAVILTVSAIGCYIVISLISFLLKRKAPDSHIVNLTICYNGISVCGTALFDTGNTLKEPFSSFPVVVCERTFVEKLIPKWFDIKESSLTEGSNQIRFVSYKSVGGEGLLPAFKPDLVTVYDKGKKVELSTVYIAVYSKTLSGGEYNALIGNLFFETYEKGAKGNEKDIALVAKSILSNKK
ncbi:MAG: sigma-E processing peptidase SpoIIGA [Oscillospiraceae bacterium]|nr:sigma-E processing peptidase SpoIIGA [Oscillospiraceae bacterium]